MGHARRRDAGTYLNYGYTRPRVISQGPVGGYPSGGEMYFDGTSGEEIPTPQPMNGMDPTNGEAPPAPIPTPASYLSPAGTSLLSPPGTTQRESFDVEQADAIGTGAVGTGVGDYPARPLSFEWEGVSVPARGASADSAGSAQPAGIQASAEPGRLPNVPASSMRPLRPSGDAWKAKQ
jgi:hypothetical protein